jgi:hypothetical protein
VRDVLMSNLRDERLPAANGAHGLGPK